jgi:DNA-binding LacI/PurR family transcriptional regulator
VAVTLRDIAKHVNLSHATVSFVLNDRRDVAIPETTRNRVMEAAKELGYHPNRAARALVMGQTRVIGLYTPELSTGYVQRLFLGLADRFRSSGFDSLFCTHAAEGAAHPFGWPVDGIVYVQGRADSVDMSLPHDIPIVAISTRTRPELDTVHIDLASGTTEAVMHLLEAGRSDILCLSDEPDQGEGSIAAAFTRTMAMAGKPGRVLTVTDGSPTAQFAQINEHLRAQSKLDAIYCASDEITGFARRVLWEMGRSIPQDTALVGFGYSEEFIYRSPSLTAVEVPVEAIADQAKEMLLARLSEPARPQTRAIAPTILRVLESSAPRGTVSGTATVL